MDRGKGEIGDGSVSILHIAREKTLPPPPKKRALYTAMMERDNRARDGAVESALSSVKNASSVVKAILDPMHSF